MKTRSVAALVLAVVVTAGTWAGNAWAQAYPTKQIRWVIPYPPGGGTDVMGRMVAEGVSARIGQPVVVVNTSGGSGTVGSESVRRAEPDGYTLLFNASLFVLGKHVVKAAPYDPLTDFTPVARIGEAPLVLIGATKLAPNTFQELVAALRASPDKYNFAASSLGSAGHLATLDFLRLAGAKIQVVPYRGASPALADIAGGNVELLMDPLTSLLPQVQGGRAKAFVVTSQARSPLAPEIPTTAESGMPDLTIVSWYGVWGPKGLPQEVVTRISGEIGAVSKDPAFNAKLEKFGIRPTFMGPDAAPAFYKAEQDKAVALLKAANFEAE